MKTSRILAALAAFAAIPAMAQFSLDQGIGDLDTKVSIKSTGPGAAELTFTGVKLVYLNRDPKVAGVTAKTDVSGKGKAYVVDPKVAPADAAGAEVHLTGIGRGGWAALGNKVDPTKTKSAALADAFTVPVTIKGNGGCAGFTLLAVKDGQLVPDVWVSKPGVLLKRGNGVTDHTLVLCTDAAGAISMATAEQTKAYAPVYAEVTTAAKK